MTSVPMSSQVTEKMKPSWLTIFFHVPQSYAEVVEVMQSTLEKRQAKTLLPKLVLYIPVTIF